MITSEELKAECLRRRYAELLEKPDTFPSGQNWAYIINNRMFGLGPALYRKYLVALMLDEEQRSGLHTAAIRHFPEYLRAVDRCHALDTLYGDPYTLPDAFCTLVCECELFDATRVLALLASGGLLNLNITIHCLKAFQPVYTAADLADMERLLEALRHLPVLGRIEERRGLLGVQRKYICASGHASAPETEFCQECGIDIFGLDEAGHRAVEDFARRCEALRGML